MDNSTERGEEKITEKEVPFRLFLSGKERVKPSVDMNRVVGSCDILFICLDTLRYDAAVQEEKAGGTPILNQYGSWEKCQAPGNFTYPSHHAMFAGFLPCRYDAKNVADREMLFFPKSIGLGKKTPEGAYGFSGSTIMEGLEKDGYEIHGAWEGFHFSISVRISERYSPGFSKKATGTLLLAAR